MIPNGYLIFEDESFLDSTVAKMNALRKSGQFCDVRLQVRHITPISERFPVKNKLLHLLWLCRGATPLVHPFVSPHHILCLCTDANVS